LTKRLALLLVLLVLAVGAWRLFLSLGHILHHEDPLERADVIYVLGGTRVERVAEAGQLFAEGWAPRVLLSRQIVEPAEARLRARGVAIVSETEMQRSVLEQIGVPPAAIDQVTAEQNATADEIEELADLSRVRGWTRLIVVTSKMHTARARLTLRRKFAGSGKEIIVRASRYDPMDVDRWWQKRSDFRFALFESQKLVAYWLGIGD
jgi:uncharacterized SAM-binding protein YcdF (DUF218 family)